MNYLWNRAKHQGGTLLSLIHFMCKSLGTFALGEWILNFNFGTVWSMNLKRYSRCRLSQNSNRRGWFDLISFLVFRTFFLWPPFIFVSPVSCHWPGMGSDTCGDLGPILCELSSRLSSWTCSGRFTLLWPLLPKGVASVSWGCWWLFEKFILWASSNEATSLQSWSYLVGLQVGAAWACVSRRVRF